MDPTTTREKATRTAICTMSLFRGMRPRGYLPGPRECSNIESTIQIQILLQVIPRLRVTPHFHPLPFVTGCLVSCRRNGGMGGFLTRLPISTLSNSLKVERLGVLPITQHIVT